MVRKPSYEELEQRVKELEQEAADGKRTEEQLRDSQEWDRFILDSITDGWWVLDKDLCFVKVNKAGADFVNLLPEKLIGKKLQTLFPQIEDTIFFAAYERSMAKQTAEYVSDKFIFADGREGFYQVRVYPVPEGILCVGKDVSDEKQAEEALRESERRYRVLVEHSGDVAYSVSADGILTFVGPQITHFGYASEEVMSKHFLQFVAPEHRQMVTQSYENGLKNETTLPTEFQWQGKDGHLYWVEVVGKNFYDDSGKPTYQVGVMRDINDRKQAEEALKKKDNELRVKAKSLEEMNTALRVLLRGREEDKGDLEEKVLSNVKDLVMPYVEKLKNTSLDNNQTSYLSVLESNLDDIVSPFARTLSSKYLSLTPTEIRVAHLVKDGKTTKEIAEFMHLSVKTIEFHRDNIRKKLGIKGKKTNLRTKLLSM